ncbi:MAG: hypothetical protein DRP63_05205 [Planctomycetota bacterium]|nr:MAG: hypothetical protein DRP63_05205 [Planctomycetota bacterium]
MRVLSVVALVAACLLVASADDYSRLKKQLLRAVKNNDLELAEKTLTELLEIGDAKAAHIIITVAARVPKNQNRLYWQMINALGVFTDPDALAELGRLMVSYGDKRAIGRDVLFALQRNRTVGVIRALREVLTSKCPRDMREMAAEMLGSIRRVESVDVPIVALNKSTNKPIRDVINDSLRGLTGMAIPPIAKEWEQWWSDNRARGLPKKRKKAPGKYTGTVVDQLDDVRKRRMFGGEKIKLKVLVITACCDKRWPDFPKDPDAREGVPVVYDRIEDITRRMGIETVVVYRWQFEKPNYKIPDDVLVVCINCTQIHPFCICKHCHPVGKKHDRLFT